MRTSGLNWILEVAEISYYDNVKDDVKDQNTGEKANFDTLRKAAEESSGEETEGDDTEIEVLEEGLKRSRGKAEDSRSQPPEPDQVSRESADASGSDVLEQKLDRIIEQNERMIDILESFRG